MPDRVGPVVHDVQPAARNAQVDRAGAHSERQQLPSRDAAVLALRKLRDQPIGRGWPAITTYMSVITGHRWWVAGGVWRVGAWW